ncbi:MAG: ribosome assembly factor SBDS [Candidatus Verstraetearchaeota archaeon]|nr:ribosome assembly factor SBDS [Candidatus Verstraetearchaeota archaeon]
MPKEEKSVIARLVIRGEHFEVLVNPDLAWHLKNGKEVDFKELLISEMIYKDASKGLKASEESVKKNFGTEDVNAVASAIIKKGELQLTTEQRREMIESKRKQIINFISRNCVDPKSGLPHPPQRIENAMSNVRLSIDPFKPVEEQAQEVIKALRTELPLKVSQVVARLSIPAGNAKRVYAAVSKMGTVARSEWLPDGSWRGELVLPAGIQQNFVDRVNEITRGNCSIDIKKI